MSNEFYYNKMPLNKDSKAVGNCVIVEIVPQPHSARKYGNIFLPSKHIENTQLIVGKIHSASSLAKEEDMKEGDLVFYDKGSAYGLPPETVGTLIVTHMENIIAKVELQDSMVIDAIPYGRRLMVGDFTPEATEAGGIIIVEAAQVRSNVNVVHRLGTGDLNEDGSHTGFPFDEGATIVVDYDMCTALTVSEKKVYIVDIDKVIAIIHEDEPKPKKKK